MKIFFNCTTAELIKYKKNYLSIRKSIVDGGHILTRDWIPLAIKRIEGGEKYQNPQQFFPKVMRAMEESDAIIVEDTVSNFSTGFAITYAIQRRKPVLVLWSEEKNRHFKDTFLHGVDADYLEIASYKMKDINEIVTVFLRKYETANERNRFHLVIDGVERRYLDWLHYTSDKSRTQIIRDSIRERLDHDKEYRDYLKA